MIRVAAWLVGVPAALFAAVVAYSMIQAVRNPENPVDRIAAGCAREFGYRGAESVADCQARLLLQELAGQERARLDRARR